MEGGKTSGTSLPDGSSTTNSSRTTYAGSYRYLACTTYTKKMGRSTISKISSVVCFFCHGEISRINVRGDVFKPLFEVTKDPSSHPKLHVFLQRVVGFDTVDDESKTERRYHRKFPYPKLWDYSQSPPYSYWFVMFPEGFHILAHLLEGSTTCLQTWQVSISGVEPVDLVSISFRRIGVSLIKTPRHIRLSSARWRGWRHGSSHVCLPDISFHLPRHLITQSPRSTILVLPQTNRHCHEPAEQQRTLPYV
jgi:hypothetical protein